MHIGADRSAAKRCEAQHSEPKRATLRFVSRGTQGRGETPHNGACSIAQWSWREWAYKHKLWSSECPPPWNRVFSCSRQPHVLCGIQCGMQPAFNGHSMPHSWHSTLPGSTEPYVSWRTRTRFSGVTYPIIILECDMLHAEATHKGTRARPGPSRILPDSWRPRPVSPRPSPLWAAIHAGTAACASASPPFCPLRHGCTVHGASGRRKTVRVILPPQNERCLFSGTG